MALQETSSYSYAGQKSVGNGITGAIQAHPIKNRFANEIIDRLSTALGRLDQNNNRLEMALERSFGAVPQPAQAGTDTPIPNNHVNVLVSLLNRLETMITEQQDKLTKLEEIV